jgi:4-aminobutyrate aminotransferase-like enzyme
MGEKPITITDGDGAYVRDQSGNEYLDFVSQLYCVNAGHSNDAILDAMHEQLDRVQYVSSAKGSDVRGRGFHWAVEFADPETGEPIFDPRVEEGYNPVADVVARTREKGVLIGGGRPMI